MPYTEILSLALLIFGIMGSIILLSLAAFITHTYHDCHNGSFRWHIRNAHLKHLSAVASLFFLAIAASYVVLNISVLAILFLVIGLKAGTWWLQFFLYQRF